jgi:tyrosine-protein kinase Etk/Wzc
MNGNGDLVIRTAQREIGRAPLRREMSLQDVATTLADSKWLIAKYVVIFAILASAYLFLAIPVYRADALIKIDTSEARSGTLGETDTIADLISPVSAELQVVKSRAVLQRVVDELALDIVAEPKYLPIIGKPIAYGHGGEWMKGQARSLKGYAWGGEEIAIGGLEVGEDYRGEAFEIVKEENEHFVVIEPGGAVLGRGTVGQPFIDKRVGLRVEVTRLEGQPGTRYSVVRRPVDAVVEEMRNRLGVREEGRDSRVIRISLEGQDRARSASIVNAVATAYMRRQSEWRSKELEETLDFLEQQKARLKAETDRAAENLGQYRQNSRSIDVQLEAERLLDRAAGLESRLAALQLESEKYLPAHPNAGAIAGEIRNVQTQLNETYDRLKRLPEKEQRATGLSRDAQATGDLYASLINDIHRIRLMTAVSPNSMKLLDEGEASFLPVRPKSKVAVFSLATVLGMVVGTMAVIWKRVTRAAVVEPSEIEDNLKVPVYAIVAYSDQQKLIGRSRSRKTAAEVLATSKPHDPAIEALRALRTWLATPGLAPANRSLLVTGPSVGVGKSFISANLAAVLAAGGKRVLLIDGDLRKGAISRQFWLENALGLSNLLSGAEKTSVLGVHRSQVDRLHVMPRGTLLFSSEELLATDRFSEIMREVSAQYDYVIVDSPPVLPVADAVAMGQSIGTALMVVRQGVNTLEEINDAQTRLQHAGVEVKGFVVNGLTGTKWKYGYAYGDAKYEGAA